MDFRSAAKNSGIHFALGFIQEGSLFPVRQQRFIRHSICSQVYTHPPEYSGGLLGDTDLR